MEAKITIRKGVKVMFSGTVQPGKEAYRWHGGRDEFHADLLNIERYINQQGSYRCHIETEDAAKS